MRKTKPTKYKIDGKEIKILKEDWDFLIILDACRYDIFKDVYREHFDKGTLKKAISPATGTAEWFKKIFKNKYFKNIVYVSANPQIRAIGMRKQGIDADEHFFKVIDVWYFGWNDELCTVHPIEVNKAFHRALLKHPDKRFILHYLQPHAPYILMGGIKEDPLVKRRQSILANSKYKKDFNERIRNILGKYLQAELAWRMGKMFGILSQRPMGQAWYKFGRKGVRNLYRYELRRVLKHVKMLVDSISGNWLITADHGERLGEGFKYAHEGPRDKEVIEVPWFEIKK